MWLGQRIRRVISERMEKKSVLTIHMFSLNEKTASQKGEIT
jgi:hypothetical protein